MTSKKRQKLSGKIERWRLSVASLLLIVMSLTGGCFLDHEVEPYYGRSNAPRAQEFRWSDGGLPQVFDPALAAAAPDTDAVRAIFEGLTEYDPKTLAPVPGVAARWESSSDSREWTFYLRRDARWSNGEPVTAQDFVRSWQRTLQLGERAPHAKLLKNIQGVMAAKVNPTPTPAPQPEQAQGQRDSNKKEEAKKETKPEALKPQPFGAEAIDDYTLRVRLQSPDPGFPALASHPIFRPVNKLDSLLTDSSATANSRPISNGAFQLSKVEDGGVVLERAKNYWDAQSVSLQRVQFVPMKDAESALAAYHAGEVDAVTNAGFEPLALKLLAPYRDFRRATFGALTYYSFNTTRPPFDDARVREALTIAIDRDRISEDQLDGATEPAKKFLPAQLAQAGGMAADHAQVPLIKRDVERARQLLADAGYAQGQKFPKIRLLVNRNSQQRQIAETIAAMWRSALNVETEIVLKDWAEYEIAFRAGDYDVARRSYVMQTADETSSLREMFEAESSPLAPQASEQTAEKKTEDAKNVGVEMAKENGEKASGTVSPAPLPVLSEAQALRELPAMPIYFASSYALVKPYVTGFETNLLDAPSLKHVRIDTSWQQPKQASMIWFKTGK
jgi:ABC-type oligopeptide transport system substrate-binding subunit